MVSCKVAHEEHSIYAFHSYNDGELCRDFERKRYFHGEKTYHMKKKQR